MKTIYILLITVSISLNCKAQESYKIYFNVEEGDEQYDSKYNLKSDTTNYYIVFEADFLNDSVKVYSNDILIFNNIITTDVRIDVAKKVRIGNVDTVKSISFQINNNSIIYLEPLKGKYYIRVKYSKSLKIIKLILTKFMFFNA